MGYNRNKYEAVIFDMDGVIVNTEPIYKKANDIFFEKLGFSVDDELYETFIGISAHKMWGTLKQKFNLTNSIESYIEAEQREKRIFLEQETIQVIIGIASFITSLSTKSIPLAIASSSTRKNIDLILMKTKLSQYFDAIVSGEDITNGKPAPDIFIKAANSLNIPAEKCIVIEDSQNGTIGGKAANMVVVGLQNPYSGAQDLSMADIILEYSESIEWGKILSFFEN